MKKFRVWAKETTYLYTYIEAETAEEAEAKAAEMDGGEFVESYDSEWEIIEAEEE